jgi:hypothetical protein
MVFLAAWEKEGGIPSPGDAEVAITGAIREVRESTAPNKKEATIAHARILNGYLFSDIGVPPHPKLIVNPTYQT